MNATFRQLQLFLALADHGSIRAAAAACHVTQPTVSMQLRELSGSVGLPLYEVIGKRIFLTEAGNELAATARAMADEWSAFSQRIDQIRGLARGRLKVAVVSTAEYFVPRLVGNFCARHREIEIAFQVLNRDGVLRRLRENLDDLYIMSMPPKEMDIEQQAFLANPLVMIAARTHPLAGRKRVALQRLAQEPVILREQGSGTRLACDAHFERHGFRPRVRMELGSNEAIKQAVAGGMGIAVLSTHALPAKAGRQALAVLDVRGFPIHSNWFIVRARGKKLSPVAARFLESLVPELPRLSPPRGRTGQ